MAWTTKYLYEPLNVGASPSAIITVEVYEDGVRRDSRMFTMALDLGAGVVLNEASVTGGKLISDLAVAKECKRWFDEQNALAGFS